jgi:hypothetical protein
MGGCHRFDAAVESGYELGHRAARLLRARGDRRNNRQDVLNAVIEFGNQRILVILELLAFTAAP